MVKNIPNLLTVSRLIACPILIYFFFLEKYLIILTVFILACVTDLLDGYIARKNNLESNFGKVLDPIADKVLIITMSIMLIINEDISGIHKIAFYIIIFREILITCLRFNLDKENKNIEVNKLSKYKTFIQMIAIGSVIIFHNFKLINFQLPIIILIWSASYITFLTGFQHFRTYLKLKK